MTEEQTQNRILDELFNLGEVQNEDPAIRKRLKEDLDFWASRVPYVASKAFEDLSRIVAALPSTTAQDIRSGFLACMTNRLEWGLRCGIVTIACAEELKTNPPARRRRN